VAIAFPDLPPDSLDSNHPAKDLRKHGALVRSAAELRDAVITLTRDETARRAALQQREAYLNLFLGGADGEASRRVASLIERLATNQDPSGAVAATTFASAGWPR
jgi:hypothetical protein